MPSTPFPQIPNVVRVIFRAMRDGNERILTFHYRSIASVPDAASMTALAEYLDDSIGLALSNIICVGTDLLDIQVTDLTEPDGAQVTVDWAHGAAGGTSVLPANVALVLSKHTTRSGRSNRGRLYVPDISEDYFAGSTFNVLYTTNVMALADAMKENPVAGYEPVVASHTTGEANVITSVTINQVACTQRRRLPGHGS